LSPVSILGRYSGKDQKYAASPDVRAVAIYNQSVLGLEAERNEEKQGKILTYHKTSPTSPVYRWDL
jgi:hypothetical protein